MMAKSLTLLLPVALLGACAQFSVDGGMAPVSSNVSLALGKDTVKISSDADESRVAAQVSALLAKTLTPDSAVQIALLNNRGLQAEYNSLGVSEADFVEATLPPIAPSIILERALSNWEFSIERRLAVGLIQLATWPTNKKIAKTEFRAAQYRATEATFRTAAATRRAFFVALAAKQRVAFLERARATASIAAKLTVKQGETGAASRISQARAVSFYAEVAADLAQARLDLDRAREALTRELGLWKANTSFRLPDALPKLPKIRTVNEVEQEAVSKRVDLIAARLDLDATARRLGLTNATRYVSLLELTGISRTTWTREDGSTSKSTARSLELVVEIPIFDFGETRKRRAAETYMQSVNLLVELAVNVRSQAREAYTAYRATYDIARQYQDNVIPLRNIIDEQTLLEYNGMLVDVYELLNSARESLEGNIAAIEAARDFFIAQVDFQAALIGGAQKQE